jgi:ADP-ribose pyrophosphatase
MMNLMQSYMLEGHKVGKIKDTDKIIYEGHFTLVSRPFEGKNHDIVVSKDAAIMLYVDEEDQVYFAKQFRPAIDEFVLSLPAETLDKEGLSPKEVMIEGLEEERGIKIDDSQVDYVGKVCSTDGHDTEFVHMFIGRGKGEYVGERLEDDERIEVVKMPFDEAYKKVLSNELKGSKTNYLILYEKLKRMGEIKENGI